MVMKKRRNPSIFDIFEGFMKEFPFEEERSEWFKDPFEELIKKFEDNIPEEYRDVVKEGYTPFGKSKRYGPFVYGFSYTSEPGKEPVFREFGNIKPTYHGGIQPSSGREPLVDVMEEEKGYKVFAELPGVDKSDIKLDATEGAITIEAIGEKKFLKQIDLDCEIDPDSSKASYKNGVLSIELEKKETQKKGTEISIE